MSAFISIKSFCCRNCESVCSIAEANFVRTSRGNALLPSLIALVFVLVAQEARACTVNITGVNFGRYDVFSNVALHSAGNIDMNCPIGVGYHIILTAGSGTFSKRVMSSGAHSLNYNLFTAANRVLVWGDATSDSVTVSSSGTGESVNHVVYGRIPAHQNVYPGSYSDTITVVINF